MYCDHNADLIPAFTEIETLAEGVCPVAWAKKCVDIARHENCGKSVMCRDGMTQLQVIIGELISGRGQSEDIELIRDLCAVIKESKGCEIAIKAAEAVLYSLERYGDEWDSHCRRHRCAALACPAYYSVYIDPAVCDGCGKCLRDGVAGAEGMIHVVTDDSALKTEEFFAVCPVGAIKKAGAIKPALPAEPVPVGSFESGGGRRRRRRGAGGDEQPRTIMRAEPVEDEPAAEPEKTVEEETMEIERNESAGGRRRRRRGLVLGGETAPEVKGKPAAEQEKPAAEESSEPEEKEKGRVYEVRMNYQAGYEEYVKWPCEGQTIHSGVGWFHPFGRSSYVAIVGPCDEAKDYPAEKYLTEEWLKTYDNSLFCIYRLDDGDIYAWDGIYAVVGAESNACIPYNSDYFRRDVLTNIVVGGTGRYKGASGILIGTAEGSGDTKDVGDDIVLPRSLIKCLRGYIKLPED